MTMTHTTAVAGGVAPAIGFFERYLTVWVALCMIAGILLGGVFPSAFHALAGLEFARVNIPVGILIWVMIIPMLIKIDFGALAQVRSQWRGIGVTLFINWMVKPFSMAFLGWLFIRHVFAGWLPAEQLDSYIAGLILLAAAPCTAMVFVWSQLCKGDPYFTLSGASSGNGKPLGSKIATSPPIASSRRAASCVSSRLNERSRREPYSRRKRGAWVEAATLAKSERVGTANRSCARLGRSCRGMGRFRLRTIAANG